MEFENIRPQTKQELARAYGVSVRTLTNWLKPFENRIGKRIGHTYTPKQMVIIYEILGPPYNSSEHSKNNYN